MGCCAAPASVEAARRDATNARTPATSATHNRATAANVHKRREPVLAGVGGDAGPVEAVADADALAAACAVVACSVLSAAVSVATLSVPSRGGFASLFLR